MLVKLSGYAEEAICVQIYSDETGSGEKNSSLNNGPVSIPELLIENYNWKQLYDFV